MRNLTKLFIIVFFILTAVKVSESQSNYTISGKARYADNHEIVTSGRVNLYKLDGSIEATGEIQSNGDWIIIPMIVGEKDLIGFPGIGNEEDFMPTGLEQRTNPAEFVHINVNGNITGVELLVKRYAQSGGMPFQNTVTVSGLVLNDNNEAVSDAVVYVQSGSNYYAHGVTNSKGEYKINNVPTGDYILVAHKVGSESDYKNVTITEKGMNNLVFNVTPKQHLSVTTDPFDFKLSQNYPNPFNPNTVISYSVPKDGFVTLKVFNTVGQQVAELISTNQNAGTYNVEFNAQNLSSGVYYYRLETNGFVDTKKMILVK
jgi:hypothetical protein